MQAQTTERWYQECRGVTTITQALHSDLVVSTDRSCSDSAGKYWSGKYGSSA